MNLTFSSMDDFKPDVVAGKVPELRALMAARILLRDLKSNLLDNATFRRELENILKDSTLSDGLRAVSGENQWRIAFRLNKRHPSLIENPFK